MHKCVKWGTIGAIIITVMGLYLAYTFDLLRLSYRLFDSVMWLLAAIILGGAGFKLGYDGSKKVCKHGEMPQKWERLDRYLEVLPSLGLIIFVALLAYSKDVDKTLVVLSFLLASIFLIKGWKDFQRKKKV